MQKLTLTTLLFFVLVLTACGSASNSTDEPASAQEATAIAEVVSTALAAPPTFAPTQATPAALSTTYPDAAPVLAQLIAGTLQLEGSQLAVTAAQASTLLPIWSALKDLGGNNAATQRQYDDLTEQALQAMTDEQIQAIALMQITRESLTTVIQQQELAIGNQPGNGMGQGGGPGGARPEGTPPANGTAPQGMPPGGTPPANEVQGAGSLSVPPGLLDAFIQFLEQKASA
ncbi:MAG: hypothetical protein ACOYYU_05100 [Chloroflexota bacterium]